jgi:hypothetical protein
MSCQRDMHDTAVHKLQQDATKRSQQDCVHVHNCGWWRGQMQCLLSLVFSP